MLEASAIGVDRLSPLVDLGPARMLAAGLCPALAGAGGCPLVSRARRRGLRQRRQRRDRSPPHRTHGRHLRRRAHDPAATARSAWVVPDGLWAYRLDRQRAVLGGALSNGGNLLRWIWNTTGTDRDDETTTAAAALARGLHRSHLLPFLAGERSPGWHDNASGVIAGLTLSRDPNSSSGLGWRRSPIDSPPSTTRCDRLPHPSTRLSRPVAPFSSCRPGSRSRLTRSVTP